MDASTREAGCGSPGIPIRLSTSDVPARDKHAWLVEEIGRHYAAVQITPPREHQLFNEMSIYPWGENRFSLVRSNPLRLERRHGPARYQQSDTVFAIMLLSGSYHLRQDGREASLRPGDLCLYDTRLPHRIDCPDPFSKLVIRIPGDYFRARARGAATRFSSARPAPLAERPAAMPGRSGTTASPYQYGQRGHQQHC